MEELLNKLIEKGWKPFGKYDKIMAIWRHNWRRVFDFGILWEVEYSIRELVSKESWLWQFVCEHSLLSIEYDITKSYKDSKDWTKHWGYNWDKYLKWYDMYNYQYRIIESALCDEDKLEQFILDNVKIEWE